MDRRSRVTKEDVAAVISLAAQIPQDMIVRDVTDRFQNIDTQLQRRVVGQAAAVRAVARRLVLNKGPLKDGFDRPDGVLLFLGPTGVGKTEAAKAVAEFLFGDEKKLVRIDMSEYQDGAMSVDKLIGMPRGIAGSERGGFLTNQLKDHPYRVVLLDEIEKASPPLLNVFLQAFDEGWLTDGRGTRVYLSDAIIIMTSNLGSEHFRRLTSPLGFPSRHLAIEQVQGEVRRELERRFSPEFRNRIDEVVLFAPLTRDDVRQIARGYLTQLEHTDDLASHVDQRTTRIARVDRGIGLQHVLKTAFRSGKRAAPVADDAHRHGMPKAEWIADRHHPVARFQIVRIAEGGRRQISGPVLQPDQRTVCERITSDDIGSIGPVPVTKYLHSNLLGARHDMIVRHDLTAGADKKT
jgi:MoxR-like ATPase